MREPVGAACQTAAMSRPGHPKRDELAVLSQAAQLWDQEVQEIGYLARVFAQTCLPYRNPGDDLPEWVRHNGNLMLTLQPGPARQDPKTGERIPVGYPYGTIPRLLLMWLSTEAVRTKERAIPLGTSLSDFMRQLGLSVNGGSTGNIGKLRDQIRRLFKARITVEYRESSPVDGYQREAFKQLTVADNYDLWWSERMPTQVSLMPSYVELSEKFFEEVTTRPVPLSFEAIGALRGSPIRLDIYAWLTHRMSYLSKPSHVSWAQLQTQFGSNYQDTKQGRRKFRLDFEKQLGEVLVVYRDANVQTSHEGLLLLPSRPHVSRKSASRQLPLPGSSESLSRSEKGSKPSPQVVEQYCGHGGEAGTLPDGTARCPSCRHS